MPTPKYLIVVGGTTASGKTAFAIRLAQHFNTAIISVDSRQFFKEMAIGTAKPTMEELNQAPHHFINHLSIHSPYSVGDFEREAIALLEQLFQQQDVVVVSGGSGLYLKAMLEGIDDFPAVPVSIREEVERTYQVEGLSWLQRTLQSIDLPYYQTVDLQNPHRLIRAIAVYRASGKPFSSFLKTTAIKRAFTPIYLQLYWPRQIQYERINERVDRMMQQGQVEEARGLHPYRHLTALQTVGYQELFDYFEGKTGLEDAISLIKQNSRRYAKRQLTWMRRDRHWKHLHPTEWELALQYIDLVRSDGICFKTADETLMPVLVQQLAEKGIVFPERSKVDFLLAVQGEEIMAVVPLQTLKKQVLPHPICHFKPLPEMAIALLRHEAIAWAEDLPIFSTKK